MCVCGGLGYKLVWNRGGKKGRYSRPRGGIVRSASPEHANEIELKNCLLRISVEERLWLARSVEGLLVAERHH